MSRETCCIACGCERIDEAPGGLCPNCLLRQGLAALDEPAPPDSDPSPVLAGAAALQPQRLDVAALASYFPQLVLLEPLGQGGMGAVFKALQTKLDRPVALKVIRPESAADPAFAERFNREAKTLARLNHANIVSIHDFGEVQLDQPGEFSHKAGRLYYFIMEFVDGANLRQLMQQGGIGPAQALAVMQQVCAALQYAHDEGVVHRDIKPENILVDSRGRVKIADFGLAKLAAGSSAEFTLTATHQVMGTLRYMAPEQMEGSRKVDHRSDIYSLGVVFYEMLTGELPMGSFAPPSQKAAVDPRLDGVVLKALAREPERRYQMASDVQRAIENILAGARPAGSLQAPLDPLAPTLVPESRGLSTMLEQGIAGIVQRFRGEGDQRSSAARFSAQQPAATDWRAARGGGGANRAPMEAAFSRKAIVAACLAPMFLIALLPSAVAMRESTMDFAVQPGYAEAALVHTGRLERALLLLLAIPGFMAPFATTILGFMAVSDIRHSEGRLRGLGLAFLDSIFFPLLFLDLGIYWFAFTLVKRHEVALAIAMGVGLSADLLILVIGWVLVNRPVRTVWRQGAGPGAEPASVFAAALPDSAPVPIGTMEQGNQHALEEAAALPQASGRGQHAARVAAGPAVMEQAQAPIEVQQVSPARGKPAPVYEPREDFTASAEIEHHRNQVIVSTTLWYLLSSLTAMILAVFCMGEAHGRESTQKEYVVLAIIPCLLTAALVGCVTALFRSVRLRAVRIPMIVAEGQLQLGLFVAPLALMVQVLCLAPLASLLMNVTGALERWTAVPIRGNHLGAVVGFGALFSLGISVIVLVYARFWQRLGANTS